MTQYENSAAHENQSYQARLADSLIASLGLDGAVHACQANTWDGVLQFVLAHRDHACGSDA